MALARGARKLQLTDLISHRAETHHPCHSMVDVAVDESESLGPLRLTVLRIDFATRRAQMIPLCFVSCVTYEVKVQARPSTAFASASCRKWCFQAIEMWHQAIVGRAKASASEDVPSRTGQPLRSAQYPAQPWLQRWADIGTFRSQLKARSKGGCWWL